MHPAGCSPRSCPCRRAEASCPQEWPQAGSSPRRSDARPPRPKRPRLRKDSRNRPSRPRRGIPRSRRERPRRAVRRRAGAPDRDGCGRCGVYRRRASTSGRSPPVPHGQHAGARTRCSERRTETRPSCARDGSNGRRPGGVAMRNARFARTIGRICSYANPRKRTSGSRSMPYSTRTAF